MGLHVAADDCGQKIRRAAETALRDPVFARAPVLSRLLDYLIDRTIAGVELNSYTIAMDGLGRSIVNINEADTYARVAVARLRRALAQYYANNPSVDQLFIETGTYAVRLRPAQVAAPISAPIAAPSGPQAPAMPQSRRRRLAIRHWVVVVVLIAITSAPLTLSQREPQDRWNEPDFPTITVIAPQDAPPDHQLEISRQAMLMALAAYAGIFVIEDPSRPSDYRVRIFRPPGGEGQELDLALEEARSARIIWSGTLDKLPPAQAATGAANVAARLASPGGVLHSHARRQGYSANSPYGCWLRFTEAVQAYNSIGDRKLAACAQNWYEAAPQRPLAAYLYAWTLIDSSVTQLRASKREATLKEALDIIHRALILNPDFAILHLAEMRAYSFRGNRQEVRRSARAAIANARGNRLVIGMAASSLAMWSDPAGATMLADLDDAANAPFPWEHVGLFITAMMAEDLPAAGGHLEHLEPFQSGQPLLTLLKGAYARRTGDEATATAATARLKSNPMTRLVPPEAMINRLPLAPEVKARLRSWWEWPDKSVESGGQTPVKSI